MLTHKNLVSNLFEGPDLIKVINEKSTILSILPLAHAFGSTSAFLSIIRHGASIYYLHKPPSPKILIDAMQQVRPTIMGAVPLVFEKIYHKQVVPAIAKSGMLRMLSKTSLTKKLLYKIIGKKIYKLLGGRLDCVIIGGASFSPRSRNIHAARGDSLLLRLRAKRVLTTGHFLFNGITEDGFAGACYYRCFN